MMTNKGCPMICCFTEKEFMKRTKSVSVQGTRPNSCYPNTLCFVKTYDNIRFYTRYFFFSLMNHSWNIENKSQYHLTF